MSTSRCKACGNPILWARVTATGKMMPVDPEPRPDGNIELTRGRTPEATVHGQSPLGVDPDLTLYVSHFVTCPSADEFRRGR